MGGGPEEKYARQGDPDQIAALLDKYPNLFADISPGYERLFLDYIAGLQLPESWRSLYEESNDRFVIGFDGAVKFAFEKTFFLGRLVSWLAGTA